MRNRMLMRFVVFSTVVIALPHFGGSWAKAQSGWDKALRQPRWNLPELKQALDVYRRGDCQTAWEIVWPLAKAGNQEVRYFLWMSMIDRMIPPGYASFSEPAYNRHALTLAIYATLVPPSPYPPPGDPNHKWARKDIPILIKLMALGPNGDQVAQCYETNPSFRTCMTLAVSLSVVQRFEEYADDVDIETRETGRPASCKPRP